MKKYMIALLFIASASITAKVQEINDIGEFNPAIAQGISIVKFYSPACPHCVAAATPFETISAEFPEVQHFLAVNVDDFKSLANKYGVQGMPAFAIFKNGRLQGKLHYGFNGLNKLRSDMKEYVKAVR